MSKGKSVSKLVSKSMSKSTESGAVSPVNASITDVVKWRNGFKIPVFPCVQNGNVIYACVMDAERLKAVTYTEVMRPGNEKKGRQRPFRLPHSNNLKRQMEEGGIFPDIITCSPMHGAEIREEDGRMWLFMPTFEGKYLHEDNGQHRTDAGARAKAEKKVTCWQFFVCLIPFISLIKAKALRAGVTSNALSEDKAVSMYLKHQTKDEHIDAVELAAGDLIMRATAEFQSQIRDRIHYVFEQSASKVGKRLPYNQCVELAMHMWNVPEFVVLSDEMKYQVFSRAFTTWASLTELAWQDHSAYVNSNQTGLLGFMMAMPWIFRKAIQLQGNLSLDAIDEAAMKTSAKITSGGTKFQPFLNSDFGTGYPHRDAFKRMVVNGLDIFLGHDEKGKKVVLNMVKGKAGTKNIDYEKLFRDSMVAEERAKKAAKEAKEIARVAAKVAAKTAKAAGVVHELYHQPVEAF